MSTLQELIDAAIARAKSQSALAKALGWTQSDVSKMQRGKRPWTPELVGVLSDFVGLTGDEARFLAAVCVVEAAKNSAKKEVLRRAFFLSVGLGVLGFAMQQLLLLRGQNDTTLYHAIVIAVCGFDSTYYKLSRISVCLLAALVLTWIHRNSERPAYGRPTLA